MSPSAIALCIVTTVVAVAIVTGLVGAYRKIPNPGEYLVAGRSLGALLLWLLLAGEIYTAFSFLGAAGWAYGKGAPVYYILCYGPVAYIIGYFVMPMAWNVGKHFNLLTIGDFFATRYESKGLGAFVGFVGFIFLIPYVTLQMTGLQILLGIAGYGAVDAQTAVFIAVIVMALFVFVTGLRGTAWTSVVKDAVVLGGVIFAGIVMPIHFFGSPAAVIAKIEALRPGFLTLASTGTPYTTSWFISTVILNAASFFLFPQALMSVYAAKSADSLRRNYIFLPLYQIMLVLMVFAGLTGLLLMPGLTGPSVDTAFMQTVAKYYPPWVLGLIAGAGCLAALVPVSAQLLGASGLVVKNVFVDLFSWRASDALRAGLMRVLVLVLAAAALVMWALLKTTLVELLLISYNGMGQFIPGAIAAFWWRRASAWGIAAGIAAGLAVLAVESKVQAVFGINIGFIALAANAAVAVIVSYATPAPPTDAVERFRSAAFSNSPNP
jgi:SSS family solute:Na+ symporter